MNTGRQDYTALANSYDASRFEGAKGRFNARLDADIVRRFVRCTAASILLDVPTGTGRLFDYLAGERLRLIGCDYTDAMLERAKRRVRVAYSGLVRADAARLPFPDHTFDCVVCLRFFHLFRADLRQPFASEFLRVLKPRGYLICSFTNGWYGGGLNWARKLTGRLGVHFLGAGEIRRLFPGWTILAQYGNYFPGERTVGTRYPRLEPLLLQINRCWPLNRLCHERFFLMRRTA